MQLWLLRNISQHRKLYSVSHDFSTTINSGTRSADVNITGLKANKIRIIGLIASSENDTTWRAKFYFRDVFDSLAYNTNTFGGNIEMTSLSSNANLNYEGDCEASLFYQDKDRTKEVHVILENMGKANSKCFLTILYNKAD